MSMNISDITNLNIKGFDYCCIISLISKNEAVNVILFRMGFFRAFYGWREQKSPPSLKSVKYILQT